jgi:PAS domain S-box-containing protein
MHTVVTTPPSLKPANWFGDAVRWVALIVLYLCFKQITNAMQVSAAVSSWEPASGLCLAWMLVYGPRQAIGVALATLISDNLQTRFTSGTWSLSIGVLGNAGFSMLAYLAGERAMRALRFDRRLRTQPDVAMFVLCCLGIAFMLAAFGAWMHVRVGFIPRSEIASAIFHYWVVHAVGMLTIGGMWLCALDWRHHVSIDSGRREEKGWRFLAETAGQAGGLAAAVWLMFSWPGSQEIHTYYLAIPPIVWIVMRRGVRGGVLALLALNLSLMICARAVGLRGDKMVDLQTFMLVVSVSTLLLSGLTDATRRAEQEIAASEERYRFLFENNPLAMIVYDRAGGEVLDVNEAAVTQYGYSRPEFVGMGIAELSVNGADRAAHDSSTGSSVVRTGVERQRRRNGEVIEVETVAGRMTHIGPDARLLLARDVTQTRRAEAAKQQAEAALRDALQRLVTLVDNSPLAVIEWDSQFRVVRWSGEAERIFGWDAREVMGLHPSQWRFIHDDDARRVSTVMAALSSGQPQLVSRNRNYRSDGRVLWCDWHSSVLFDAEGSISSVLSLVIDTTARDEAQASVAEWKSRYEAAAVASRRLVYELVSETGEILWGSDTAPLFGCPKDHLLSIDNWVARVHADDRAMYDDAKRRLGIDRESFNLEYRVRRDDGVYVHVEDTARFFTDASGQSTRMVGFVSDVSDRVRAAQELARRAQELARSNAELERFAYVASHDLQEPLRMVISFTQLLADRYRGKLDPEADEFIGFAVEGATRMRRLIDDLLAYSRASSGPRLCERVDAGAAAGRALSNLALVVNESGAQVEIKPLPEVNADDTRLTMVFQNLIGNALKFRTEGQSPMVKVWSERQDGRVVFFVSDNGIGIEPRHQDRIFQMFQRLNPRSHFPGNGIGLTICKRIVEDLGGVISVSSRLREGSVFSFTIPAATAESGGSGVPGDEPLQLR